MVAQPDDRRGFQQSEAILTAVAMVIGAALIVCALFAGADDAVTARLMELGTLLVGGTPAAYAISRGSAKRGSL